MICLHLTNLLRQTPDEGGPLILWQPIARTSDTPWWDSKARRRRSVASYPPSRVACVNLSPVRGVTQRQSAAAELRRRIPKPRSPRPREGGPWRRNRASAATTTPLAAESPRPHHQQFC